MVLEASLTHPEALEAPHMVASAAEAGQALVGYDQATMAPDGARHPGDEHDHLGCQEKATL